MSSELPDDNPLSDRWPLGHEEPEPRIALPVFQGATHDFSQEDADQVPLANFGWRLLGFLIDGIIVGLASDLVTARIAHVNAVAGIAIALCVNFLYPSLLIGLWQGQTLGMKVCRLRCVDATTRQAPTPRQAALRALVAGLFALPSYVISLGVAAQLVDYLTPLFDKLNRTMHDKAAHTLVVREAKENSKSTVTFDS